MKRVISKITSRLKHYFKKYCPYILNDLLRINIKLLKKTDSDIQKQLKTRYNYQKKFNKFNIKKGDKVLDLGSGADPFPLATHLADLYIGKTTHRSGGSLVIKNDRPFTICNIEKTPFKDKEFDFVYCSHVLEHTNNPAKACEEIMRIGKRGYIETPTRMSDILFNFTKLQEHHKWHVNIIHNTILFIEWQSYECRDNKFEYLFQQAHSKWLNPFQSFFCNNRDLFSNMFLWENKFSYIVINKKGKIINHNFNKKEKW